MKIIYENCGVKVIIGKKIIAVTDATFAFNLWYIQHVSQWKVIAFLMWCKQGTTYKVLCDNPGPVRLKYGLNISCPMSKPHLF